jgi:excisionase family DNA binding protein
MMSSPTRENTPHLDEGSRYGPTPTAADGSANRPPPATAPPAQEQPWPPAPDPGDHPDAQPPFSPTAPQDLAGFSTSALATLPEVLTAREAAAILRIGRNQVYLAVGRGDLGAVRIGRSIRIPKQALLDLLASASPLTASGDEQPRQPATQVRQGPP